MASIQHCPWNTEVQGYVLALRAGLEEFCKQPTRVAVLTQQRLIQTDDDATIWVFDPDGLLQPHRAALRDYFGNPPDWIPQATRNALGHDVPFTMPPLHGVVSVARMIAHNAIDGTVVAVFVESVHDVAPGVILEWLTSTATILAGEIVHRDERRSDPFRVPSDGIVRFFAREAACQYIARRCSFHGDYFKNLALVRDVLTAITALSRTSEERKLPSGELLIASADGIADLDIVVEFGTEKPSLVHAKHTAKLLQAVRHSSLRLLCKSDMEVVGIAGPGAPPDNSICVRLDSGRAKVWVREEHVCNIQHGDFVAGIELQIASLQRAIQGAGDEASHLLQLVESVLRSASRRRHGCTVVLDLRRDPVPLSGQTLKSPLKLRNGETAFEVAAGLASIDGAVHIDKEGNLCAFGCLLDGEAVEHEQRSRGARYNSALRFCKTDTYRCSPRMAK